MWSLLLAGDITATGLSLSECVARWTPEVECVEEAEHPKRVTWLELKRQLSVALDETRREVEAQPWT